MEYKDIEALLEKYFEGETKLEEEAELRAFFREADVPQHLEKYRSMFNMFSEEQAVTLPETFESRLDKAILDTEADENKRGNGTIFSLPRRLVQAAAIALLIIAGVSVIWQLQQKQTQPQTAMQETYDNPEEAYKTAREALLMVSEKLNKGTDLANRNMKLLEEKTNIVN